MRDFIIYTGNSRFQKIWKKTKIKWGELAERLKETQRTSETLGEYRNMKKSEQDNIKDVGGFIGGELKNGCRKDVINRTILTLDVDFADVDFLENFKMLNIYTYICYSTHKHTSEYPRLRLLFPLSRKASAEEYEAVGRYIAKDIGIDYFDDSTYQAGRLMYYPSTSIDGKYIFETFEGADVPVDNILNSYADWTDVAEWPVSSRTIKKHQTLIKKQEPPEGKPGIIGAFCRTYNIEDCITEFLSDTYTPCSGDRYTYIKGSTSAGAVVYDDSFIYSNHSTDPAGGKLCNSFDIARIHRFGHLDEDAEGVGKSLPSYSAMISFASENNKVKQTLHEERTASAREQFKDFDLGDEESNSDWSVGLEVDKKGNVLSSIDNAKEIIINDPLLKKKVKYNEFTGRGLVVGALPWDKSKTERGWSDTDDAGLRHYLEKIYKIKGKNLIDDARLLAVKTNSYHPLKEFLNAIVWDGKPRAESVFIDYLGAEDNAYIRNVSRKVLTACVARVYDPGCKFDIMPVLIGQQGCGKSYIIKRLGKDWFTDTLNSINDKGAYEQIQGFWIVEIAELSAMKKAEIESIKHFITKTEDTFRSAYGRHTDTHKRQCVFIGSTNRHDFLTDMTGNRRFMPVDVHPEHATKNVFTDLTDYEVDQIWAEAVMLYKQGEKLYIDNDITHLAEQVQDEHLEDSPLKGDVENFLDMLLPTDWEDRPLFERRNFIKNADHTQGEIKRTKVCVMEIWCELLGGEKKDLTQNKAKEITQIVLKTGKWKRSNKTGRVKIYGSQKGFDFL